MITAEAGFGPEAYDTALTREFTIPEARGFVCRATGIVNDRVDVDSPSYPLLVGGLQIAHDVVRRLTEGGATGDTSVTFAEIANSATVGILEKYGSDRLPGIPASPDLNSPRLSDEAADMLRVAFLLAFSDR